MLEPRPFLKWVGGKGRLVPEILQRMPQRIGTYIEGFVGGGAMFFALSRQGRFHHAVLADVNAELVGTFGAVRNNVDAVIAGLRRHVKKNSEEHYYRIRALDPWEMSPAERAARLIYLNKTGYNGLHRVNQSGGFNVPWGRYKNPGILDESNLRACSIALQGAYLLVSDFEAVTKHLRLTSGDVAYFDPPYIKTKSDSFVSYSADGFGMGEQLRLRDHAARLRETGCSVLLSNSDTAEGRRIYEGWTVETLDIASTVGCDAAKRKRITELLIHSGAPSSAASASHVSGEAMSTEQEITTLKPPKHATPTLHIVQHSFTQEELIEFGQHAADLEVQIEEQEARLKATTKSAKGEIEAMQAQLSSNLRSVREKSEERDVQALTWIDETAKMRIIVDADTNEVLDREPLTASELQSQLDFEKGRVAGANGLEVADDDPQWGSTSAPVTIIQFVDFENEACEVANTVVEALKTTHGEEKLLVVCRHAPESGHKGGMAAAKASVAVHKQQGNDGFWRFFGLAIRNPRMLIPERLEQWATDAGADRQTYKKEIATAGVKGKVAKDIFASRGVSAKAPELRINGIPVREFDSLDAIQRIVANELAEAEKLTGDDQANASAVLTARNTEAHEAVQPVKKKKAKKKASKKGTSAK